VVAGAVGGLGRCAPARGRRPGRVRHHRRTGPMT
jgi:hypothetical protein